MNRHSAEHCDAERLQQIVALSSREPDQCIAALQTALQQFPIDERLHFLLGSLLIGRDRHVAAHSELLRAVELAPQYHIARFQLGFFELTSGEADAAQTHWSPLHNLDDGHYLREFAIGLEHLIVDQFEACIAHLTAGQTANQENPALNRDMQLIIDKCLSLVAQQPSPPSGGSDVSSTSLLLNSTPGPR